MSVEPRNGAHYGGRGQPDGATFPAGWPLRLFRLDQLLDFVAKHEPPILELSKDFLTDSVSLKGLARGLGGTLRRGTTLSFAGTTDLVTCAGFEWAQYRDYLGVQLSQARFLGSTMFRLLIGHSHDEVAEETVISRVQMFCADAAPMQVCVEIHGGIESEPDSLARLLAETPLQVVVDLENMHNAGLTAATLQAVLPPERIAYLHVRNLPPLWIEHEETLDHAEQWHRYAPQATVLWEPKTTSDPDRVKECFDEYRTVD